MLDNRFVLGLQGVYSWNMNQPGVVDVNLDPARGFTLAAEAGRPVFVDPSAIVPTTGTIAIANSRRSAGFPNVVDEQIRSSFRVDAVRGEARAGDDEQVSALGLQLFAVECTASPPVSTKSGM